MFENDLLTRSVQYCLDFRFHARLWPATLL